MRKMRQRLKNVVSSLSLAIWLTVAPRHSRMVSLDSSLNAPWCSAHSTSRKWCRISFCWLRRLARFWTFSCISRIFSKIFAFLLSFSPFFLLWSFFSICVTLTLTLTLTLTPNPNPIWEGGKKIQLTTTLVLCLYDLLLLEIKGMIPPDPLSVRPLPVIRSIRGWSRWKASTQISGVRHLIHVSKTFGSYFTEMIRGYHLRFYPPS